jgi:uncharacterized protein (TIGR04255 family)
MADDMTSEPFGTVPIAEVPLPRSPLLRALAQVRFPRLVAMSPQNIETTVGFVVEKLKDDYPILGEQREAQVTLTPEGVTQTPGARLWQLRSPDESWQVTLGETFVSLDTKAYSSRADFAQRLETVLAGIAETIAPPFSDRLGVRYTNRVEDSNLLLRIEELVRPEILGGVAVPRPEGVALVHTLSESLYTIGPRMLHARWGLLPAGVMFDPALPAAVGSSWVLDLDSFTQVRSSFDAAELASAAEELAGAAYQYFRWVVTPEFLKAFGGEI